VITRPENNSQFCYIHDPDHTMIELVFHERRPYPPVPKKEPAEARADQGVGGGAESADAARADLAAAEGR
jgi:lactoylglutathione lyase